MFVCTVSPVHNLKNQSSKFKLPVSIQINAWLIDKREKKKKKKNKEHTRTRSFTYIQLNGLISDLQLSVSFLSNCHADISLLYWF